MIEIDGGTERSSAQVERALVARIGNASDAGEALLLYQLFSPVLQHYKFVFASDKGPRPGFAVNRTFRGGAAVRSAFRSDHVVVLDAETVREMSGGEAKFGIDYSISLDTQAMSYLSPYLGGRHSRLPSDFQEVFEFIAREDVFVDPLPYLQENLHRLSEPKTSENVFRTFCAYEVLRTIDLGWLKERNEVRSTCSSSELEARAQQLLSELLLDAENTQLMGEINRSHQFCYAYLLKMATLQLGQPRGSAQEKMNALALFGHEKLATMAAREMAVAREYFARGQELKFFGRIQLGRDTLLESLKNMAWDFWHVRILEKGLARKPDKGARYFFPALLTFDKRLIEIIDLYPLRACAFSSKDGRPKPFFDGEWFDLVAADEENRQAFVERFYSYEARTSRDERRSKAQKELPATVGELEEELLALGRKHQR